MGAIEATRTRAISRGESVRRILKAVLLLGVLLWPAGASAATEAATAERPNIVLVVSDDQGYGDASCYGATDLKTPVMDAIARRGVRFTRFRVNPLCAPTRASIMTGLYSLEAGMWRGPGRLERGPKPAQGWPDDARRIRDGVLLLPQYLGKAGYATGVFGKWHLGYDPENVPAARGFDQFVGFLGGAHPYQPGGGSQLLRGEEPLDTDKHTTDLFADEAIRFIREHRNRPFFCYIPFNAVHGPLRSAERPRDSARPDWLARYEADGVPQPRRDYCAVMSHADARVGDVLAALRELGLERRTLVVYLSDNGGILDKYPADNGPLRGGKGTAYEGGLRVPAVMQWPGVIPAGTVSHADAAHFDLFATILDAAGVQVPPANGGIAVSGRSLLPHLRSGGRTALADRYLFWDLYGQQAALHGEWKLVGELPNHRGDFRQAATDAAAAGFQLFNLEQDPGERHDLAAEYPAIHDDLKRRHVDWLRAVATGR
jgi:arylsulfatase A-like enzyme